jgi:hypothetical protein
VAKPKRACTATRSYEQGLSTLIRYLIVLHEAVGGPRNLICFVS